MPDLKSVPKNRPAETATGVTAALVAILVATTGMSTALATALVVAVGALPAFITAIVAATRSTAAGTLLVALTPDVAKAASSALAEAASTGSVGDKTTALKNVTDAMASWTQVLAAESGASPAAKEKAAKGKA